MSGWRKDKYLRYCSPTPKMIILGVSLLCVSGLIKLVEILAMIVMYEIHADTNIDFSKAVECLMYSSLMIFALSILEYALRSDRRSIKYIVRKALCDSSFGNPLNLRDGEVEPTIFVTKTDKGFKISVDCMSAYFDDVSSLETVISCCLRKKYGNYAVVLKEEDIAGRFVDYYIEDVVAGYNKQSIYNTITDVPANITKIYIRDDVYIDYAKVLNASAIVSGKSRSGKTTAIISTFLIPFLKLGRDKYDSEMIIVDPKSAELSLCPHVLSPDENGNVEHILNAIRGFNELRIKRQKYINNACRESGKAHKWFELGLHPSVLFIDEFVSFNDLIPKKASKEKPDYCLADFQGLLRQIATQGASAGCFLILSTAEASVGAGGLESAVNNACGIRILFKPCKDEARYLWSSEKLEVLRERQYSAGDAWFSADDGINNAVRFVRFPRVEFPEYSALSELLDSYYCNRDCSALSEAKKQSTVPVPDDEKTL